MPANLTGSSLAETYTSFLHVSSSSVTSSAEALFDGLGNQLPIYVSTTDVALSGNVTINNMKMPTNVGVSNQIIAVNSSGDLEYRTVVDVLTSSSGSTIVDGTYSSPAITMANGYIKTIANNTSIKTFYTRTSSITTTKIYSLPQSNWTNPVVNDVAYVMNLATNIAYKLVYTSSGWNLTETI